MSLKPKIAPHIIEIVASLQDAGYEALIVGGAVRDFLLDRQPKDYDLATSATPEEIKHVFRKQHALIIGKRFRLVHLHRNGEIIEISTFRKKPEHSELDGKKPARLENAPENMIFRDNEFGSAEEDAQRRDFTINALFYDPVHDKIYDYTGMGMEDLKKKIVRVIGDPKIRMEEDPVRILRALKLVGQYDFTMEPRTEKAVRSCMPLIRLASDSRMTLELEKILKNSYGDLILETFHEYGFLEYFLPVLEENWNSEETARILALWRLRNERIREGKYRESISLAMSLLVLPFAEKELSAKTKNPHLEYDLKSAIAHILQPRCPTKRAVAAAVRTLMLQYKFANESDENRERLRNIHGYAHARELALIRNTQSGTGEKFENLWPKGNPNKRNRNFSRRPQRRPRQEPKV